jgi:hypothetical protein
MQNTPEWLIHFHGKYGNPSATWPYYFVTFMGKGGWAGIGHLDENAIVEESNGSAQRIEW